jgi:hypothetical protein
LLEDPAMTHTGQTLADTTVELDGNEFVDCTIERCTLVYRGGGLPSFRGGRVHDCTFSLQDAADRTVELLRSIKLVQGEQAIKDLFQIT